MSLLRLLLGTLVKQKFAWSRKVFDEVKSTKRALQHSLRDLRKVDSTESTRIEKILGGS